MLNKYQVLQEDLIKRDKDRENEKEKLKNQILQKLEQKEKSLREYEVTILTNLYLNSQIRLQEEKAKYEQQLRDGYDKSQEEQVKDFDQQRKKLDQLERELYDKYDKMVADVNPFCASL
jgi:hypothetical protein